MDETGRPVAGIDGSGGGGDGSGDGGRRGGRIWAATMATVGGDGVDAAHGEAEIGADLCGGVAVAA